MINVMLPECFGHHFWLFIRHIGVIVTMNQQCRRVIRGYIFYGHIWKKFLWFFLWIPSGDCFGPQPLLTAKLIERVTISIPLTGIGNRFSGNLFEGLVTGKFALMVTWVWTRFTVPGAYKVAIAIQWHKHLWSRLHTKACGKGEVSSCWPANYGNSVWIRMEQPWSFLTYPTECIFHILDYQRQLRFRSKPVVDRDQHILISAARFYKPRRHSFTVAHDEGATMNPNHYRTLFPGSWINISHYFQFTCLLVSISDSWICGRRSRIIWCIA